MPERPIIMDAESVRAILDGRKTQTRRVVKPQPTYCQADEGPHGVEPSYEWDGHARRYGQSVLGEALTPFCPYGQSGELLWVREVWSPGYGYTGVPAREIPAIARIWYWADGDPAEGDWTKPKPSIHMPKRHARLWLRVVNVRVERLQEIVDSDDGEDYYAEGIICPRCDNSFGIRTYGEGGVLIGEPCPDCDEPEKMADMFAHRWDRLNAKRGYAWESNPWVWVIEFERTEDADA